MTMLIPSLLAILFNFVLGDRFPEFLDKDDLKGTGFGGRNPHIHPPPSLVTKRPTYLSDRKPIHHSWSNEVEDPVSIDEIEAVGKMDEFIAETERLKDKYRGKEKDLDVTGVMHDLSKFASKLIEKGKEEIKEEQDRHSKIKEYEEHHAIGRMQPSLGMGGYWAGGGEDYRVTTAATTAEPIVMQQTIPSEAVMKDAIARLLYYNKTGQEMPNEVIKQPQPKLNTMSPELKRISDNRPQQWQQQWPGYQQQQDQQQWQPNQPNLPAYDDIGAQQLRAKKPTEYRDEEYAEMYDDYMAIYGKPMTRSRPQNSLHSNNGYGGQPSWTRRQEDSRKYGGYEDFKKEFREAMKRSQSEQIRRNYGDYGNQLLWSQQRQQAQYSPAYPDSSDHKLWSQHQQMVQQQPYQPHRQAPMSEQRLQQIATSQQQSWPQRQQTWPQQQQPWPPQQYQSMQQDRQLSPQEVQSWRQIQQLRQQQQWPHGQQSLPQQQQSWSSKQFEEHTNNHLPPPALRSPNGPFSNVRNTLDESAMALWKQMGETGEILQQLPNPPQQVTEKTTPQTVISQELKDLGEIYRQRTEMQQKARQLLSQEGQLIPGYRGFKSNKFEKKIMKKPQQENETFLYSVDDFGAPIRWVPFSSNETADGLARVTDQRSRKNRVIDINGTVYVPIIDYSLARLGLKTEHTTTKNPLRQQITTESVMRTILNSVSVQDMEGRDWLAVATAIGEREFELSCKNDNCQSRCHKMGCETMCAGDTCAAGCVGGLCNAVCKGDGCYAMCIGKECSAKCMGQNCDARCRGSDCQATCDGFSCYHTDNGHLAVGGKSWQDEYADIEGAKRGGSKYRKQYEYAINK